MWAPRGIRKGRRRKESRREGRTGRGRQDEKEKEEDQKEAEAEEGEEQERGRPRRQQNLVAKEIRGWGGHRVLDVGEIYASSIPRSGRWPNWRV